MCCSFRWKNADIRPADRAEVRTAGSRLYLQFGFRLPGGKLVLNARAETAAEKPLFKDALRSSRVIVPAQCFYEWDREKVRFCFAHPGNKELLLAGIRIKDSFVILTTAANRGMAPVHDRMPLIAEDEECWLGGGPAFWDLLRSTPPELRACCGPVRGSLFA